MQMSDLPTELQIKILENVITRLTMNLLRAGIGPEDVLNQAPPSSEERPGLTGAVHYLVGQVALDALESDTGGNA
ncbi:MAG: hypothetical protein GX087_03255 [Desulfobulbaceae bacterium]|nr:hypothetical protein [Desulfobulbaceae bacterium]